MMEKWCTDTELWSWKFCKNKTCTRAFKDLIELKNHEDVCIQEEGDDGTSLNVCDERDSTQCHPLNDRKQELKIILKRLDYTKYLSQKQENKRRSSTRSCIAASRKRISLAINKITNELDENEIDDKDYVSHTSPLSHPTSGSDSESDSSKPTVVKAQKNKPGGTCKYCDMKFRFHTDLSNHLRGHRIGRPYVCPHKGCKSTFTRKDSLKKHSVMHSGTKPFKCTHCPKTFYDGSCCRRHIRIHTKEIRFTCKFCGKKFTDPSPGVVHERTHTGEKSYKCAHCDKSFNSASARKIHEGRHFGIRPQKIKNKKIFPCKHCGTELTTIFAFEKHVCGPNSVKIIEVEIPVMETITSDELQLDPFANLENNEAVTAIVLEKSSKIDKHPTSNANDMVPVNLNDIMNNTLEPFTCMVGPIDETRSTSRTDKTNCKTTIVYENDASMDFKYSTTKDISSCSNGPRAFKSKVYPPKTNSTCKNTNSFSPIVRVVGSFPVSSTTSEKEQTQNAYDKVTPMDFKFDDVVGAAPIIQPISSSVTQTQGETFLHDVKPESENNQFDINMKRELQENSNFSSLLSNSPETVTRIIHANTGTDFRVEESFIKDNIQENFQCNICKENFNKKHEINKHLRTAHKGKGFRLFKCEFLTCEKTFTDARYLAVHKRTHSRDAPFKCNMCDKAYRQAHGLRIHMRTHTKERPYKCNYCEECFMDLGLKKLHELRRHIKEPQFKCQFCDKRCFMKSYLILHVRSHTGEIPLRCTYCNKGFARPNGLKRHELTHFREPNTKARTRVVQIQKIHTDNKDLDIP